jgi:hypothetical protein
LAICDINKKFHRPFLQIFFIQYKFICLQLGREFFEELIKLLSNIYINQVTTILINTKTLIKGKIKIRFFKSKLVSELYIFSNLKGSTKFLYLDNFQGLRPLLKQTYYCFEIIQCEFCSFCFYEWGHFGNICRLFIFFVICLWYNLGFLIFFISWEGFFDKSFSLSYQIGNFLYQLSEYILKNQVVLNESLKITSKIFYSFSKNSLNLFNFSLLDNLFNLQVLTPQSFIEFKFAWYCISILILYIFCRKILISLLTFSWKFYFLIGIYSFNSILVRIALNFSWLKDSYSRKLEGKNYINNSIFYLPVIVFFKFLVFLYTFLQLQIYQLVYQTYPSKSLIKLNFPDFTTSLIQRGSFCVLSKYYWFIQMNALYWSTLFLSCLLKLKSFFKSEISFIFNFFWLSENISIVIILLVYLQSYE